MAYISFLSVNSEAAHGNASCTFNSHHVHVLAASASSLPTCLHDSLMLPVWVSNTLFGQRLGQQRSLCEAARSK